MPHHQNYPAAINPKEATNFERYVILGVVGAVESLLEVRRFFSDVADTLKLISTFLFSLLQGVAPAKKPGRDGVAGQMVKGWTIYNGKNDGYKQTKKKGCFLI